jgi:alpha-tubulin suppressor-like RCC1 family protein
LLASTRDGSLLSWGNNKYFQLGHEIPGIPKKVRGRGELEYKEQVPTPKLVKLNFSEPVVWMGAGMNESMILTLNGNLYTWGRFYLLGYDKGDLSSFSQPNLLKGFKFKIPPEVYKKKWKTIYFWLFLGRLDQDSISTFSQLKWCSSF